MSTDRASNEIKKSMAYDLFRILESQPRQASYTQAEIKKLINDYLSEMQK